MLQTTLLLSNRERCAPLLHRSRNASKRAMCRQSMGEGLFCSQVVRSLLISTVLVGVKITGLRDYVLLRLRQREIKANLELLASMFVEASSVSWAADVEHDKQQRKQRLERMGRAPPSSAAEAGLIDRGLQLLAMRQSGEGDGPRNGFERAVRNRWEWAAGRSHREGFGADSGRERSAGNHRVFDGI